MPLHLPAMALPAPSVSTVAGLPIANTFAVAARKFTGTTPLFAGPTLGQVCCRVRISNGCLFVVR